jgi:hypothetical protein
MNTKKTTSLLLGLLLMHGIICHAKDSPGMEPTAITVPIGGNGWLSKNSKAQIKPEGLVNWRDQADIISIYFRAETAGEIEVALRLSVPEGKSRISVNAEGTSLTKEVSNLGAAVVAIGNVSIKQPGYVKVELKGISRTGDVFAEVSDLIVKGDAVANAAYVKNNEGNFFYWGHRGPSVHLNYQVPDAAGPRIEWFYSEIMVPEGQDKTGTYYMANGFSSGYFGMQVNSATERRVLFSIWSPFNTDDPKSIPDSMKIVLLKKGKTTKTGEFGNEGSGGQSYMVYPWKTGKTYAFLTRAQPNDARKTTTYTSYFKDVEKGSWQLVASFERPQSAVYLKGVHSFLENFDPGTGDQPRMANYKNQWVANAEGAWHEITVAAFSADNTARKNYRKDYAGGTDKDSFFLKNCGFFDDFTSIKTPLKRQSSGQHPEIDFAKLP